MKNSVETEVKKVSWAEVREDVKQCNYNLFLLIEELDPDFRLPLFKLRYPYGVKIVDNGSIQLPVGLQLDKELRERLSYCPIPLSLLLNKESEVFVETEQRTIPLQYLSPGQFFGLFEALAPYHHHENDPKPIWQVAAGARTLFMLPKISDAIGHQKLKKIFHLQNESPKTLADHWHVFGEIVNHAMFKDQRWYSDILVFSDKWFENQHNNNAWLRFKNYLLELAWVESQMLREKSTFGHLWETLSTILLKNFRTKPYLIESVKHLMLIATGARPGFAPVNNNVKAAPVEILQQVYLDIYGLKSYLPIFMQPKRFFSEEKGPKTVYYSLSYPTVLHHAVDLEKPHRTMPEMREIMRLMYIVQQRIKQKTTTITGILDKINYAYFHSERDPYNEINLTTKMLDNQEMWGIFLNRYQERKFPVAAPFLRGVIEISSQQ